MQTLPCPPLIFYDTDPIFRTRKYQNEQNQSIEFRNDVFISGFVHKAGCLKNKCDVTPVITIMYFKYYFVSLEA